MARAADVLLACLCVAVASCARPPRRLTEVVALTGKDRFGRPRQDVQRFDMVLIPGGTFTMGSPPTEKGRSGDEGPQHRVAVRPFYMAATEVTFPLWMLYYEDFGKEDCRGRADPLTEWCEAMARLRSVDAITGPSRGGMYGDLTLAWGWEGRPVLMVSWYHAMVFCKWLSRKTGRTYRLPTEAEWEYACRAGSTTAYAFGADPDLLEDHGWFEDNAEDMTHPVATKKPNPWGLYDMHGNVAEWCLDFYGSDTYRGRAKAGPWDGTKPLDRGKVHVVRGGAWESPVEDCRSAARWFEEDWWRAEDPQVPRSRWWLPKLGIIGFRVVCETQPGNRWEVPAR